MQKVLLISGCKQSGKTSAMNYLVGHMLVTNKIMIGEPAVQRPISYFELDEKGDLYIDFPYLDENGEQKEELVKFDILREDADFVDMAENVIFPLINVYSFGNALKRSAAAFFGLSLDELNGTNEDKDKLSPIKWESINKLVKKKKADRVDETYLTNREFLEIWGTDICRTIDVNCWANCVFQDIATGGYPLCIVTDCRFKSEIEYARAINGLDVKVVRLKRRPFDSTATAEVDLLDYDGFDAVIDNTEMDQMQKGAALVELLQSWGWIPQWS